MTELKTCRTCQRPLLTSEFGKFKLAPDGLRYDCKACNNVKSKAWYEANKARRNEKAVAWTRAHPEKARQALRKYQEANKAALAAKALADYHANKDKWRARNTKFYAENPAWGTAKSKRREAAKQNATPAWANEFFIEEAYRLSSLRTQMLGFQWHVDHIVPLNSKRVCGLHTHDNLRVIPGVENSSKGNRHWPGMPNG